MGVACWGSGARRRSCGRGIFGGRSLASLSVLSFTTVPGEKKERGTISINQLLVQVPQRRQLIRVGPKHLMSKDMHLEHLAQYTVDKQRSLLVEDAFPRSLLPAAGDPVRIFHQLRRGMG